LLEQSVQLQFVVIARILFKGLNFGDSSLEILVHFYLPYISDLNLS